MKKVLWISWHPTPYNDFLFKSLGEEFELTVIYAKQKLATHPWRNSNLSGFNSLFMDRVEDWTRIIRSIFISKFKVRVVAGWDHPFFLCALVWLSLRGADYFIWTDTPNKAYKRTGIKRWFNREVITRIIQNARGVLVTGEVGVKAFREIYPKTKLLINFPFATNIDTFIPLPNKNILDPPVFISVGRLVNAHKGFDLAVSAVARIVNRNPTLRFTYLIIGDGPDRDKLEEQIELLQLKNCVRIVPWLESNETLRRYQECCFMVHPSHFDPFPNTVLEAMACGLPIIGSSAAGSVLERVVENENGFLVDQGDVDQLANRIEELLKNPSSCERLGRNARGTAERWHVSFNIGQIKRISEL